MAAGKGKEEATFSGLLPFMVSGFLRYLFYASGVWSESPLLLRRGLGSPPSGLKLAV